MAPSQSGLCFAVFDFIVEKRVGYCIIHLFSEDSPWRQRYFRLLTEQNASEGKDEPPSSCRPAGASCEDHFLRKSTVAPREHERFCGGKLDPSRHQGDKEGTRISSSAGRHTHIGDGSCTRTRYRTMDCTKTFKNEIGKGGFGERQKGL